MASHMNAGLCAASRQRPGPLLASGNNGYDSAKPSPSPSNRPQSAANGHVQKATKLFIGGISRHTTTKQLQDHFSQYGRVIDCVAMKEPNGRSRGFGYVTFNSQAAAHSCLKEPQKIDGRLVDMKLAVPEGADQKNAKAKESAANTAQVEDEFPMGMMQGSSLLGLPCTNWPNSPAAYASLCNQQQVANQWALAAASARMGLDHAAHHGLTSSNLLDCVDLLSGRAQQAAMGNIPGGCTESSGLRIVPAGSSPGAPLKLELPNTMHASAPEFVPMAGLTAAAYASTSENENKSYGVVKNQLARAPLGEITNKLEIVTGKASHMPVFAFEAKKTQSQNTVAKPPGLDLGSSKENITPLIQTTSRLLPLPLPAGNVTKLAAASKLGIMTDFMDEDSIVGPDLSLKQEYESCEDESLMSLGSAFHASGECRRCNFFTKGRCQNGKNCVFCHLPHQKKKLSRQDKRERQVQDEELPEETAVYPSSMGPQSQHAALLGVGLTKPAARSVPPGLAPPPGLAASTMPWQPEEEVSPAYASMLDQHMPYGFPMMTPPGSMALNYTSFLATASPHGSIFSTAPPGNSSPMHAAHLSPANASKIPATIATGSLETNDKAKKALSGRTVCYV